jgi:hypothetical protein
MRSHFPFLLYGSLGAIILSALDITLLPVLEQTLASAGPQGVSKLVVPVLGVACLIGVGTPVIAGLLAARSSGFTFVGALAGGLTYVGYDILRLVLYLVVAPHLAVAPQTTTLLDPTSVGVIGCQGVLGFIFGALGGLIGRRLYQEMPSYQGSWAPPSYQPYGDYGPGAYPVPPPPPSEPYGAPPTYGAGYGPASYAPPQYEPPPSYQPGGGLPPAAYPVPGYASPTDQSGSGDRAPDASGMPWGQGWPAAGEGEPPNEDAAGRSGYGWPPPTK